MTRREILKNRLEIAQHNLYCASDDYAMSKPKEGHEARYKEALEEVEALEAWLKEFPDRHRDGVREFLGHLSVISHKKNIYGRTYADEVEFEVDTGAGIMNGDDRIFHVGPEAQEWLIGDDGSACGRYDIEKDERSSVQVKIEVDDINYIRSIEWAEEE